MVFKVSKDPLIFYKDIFLVIQNQIDQFLFSNSLATGWHMHFILRQVNEIIDFRFLPIVPNWLHVPHFNNSV